MIYLVTLFIVILLVFYFDLSSKVKYRLTFYYGIMFWYICISAFQYCVGSDIPVYMYEYDSVKWSDFSWDNLFALNNRQLGWILLINLCKLISNDFVILKIIQATFVNVSFFLFFKRYSPFIYSCILFYSVFLYLDLNFNILRQSISISIFLFAYPYFVNRKWTVYYVLVFLAILFHNSAVILLFLPLCQLMKVKYFTLISFSCVILFFFIFTNFISLTDFFLNHLSLFGISSDLNILAKLYLKSQKYGKGSGNILYFVVMFIFFLWIIIFNYKKELNKSNIHLFVFFVFIFIMVLDSAVSIFARFNFYYTPIFIFLLSNFIIYFSKIKLASNSRLIFVICFICFFCYSPIKGLFNINNSYHDRQIIQYYPYYTVFDKNISPKRARFFGAYYLNK